MVIHDENIYTHSASIICSLYGSNALQPSIRVEQALTDIKDTFQVPMLAKIPFTEIATLA